MAGRVEEGIGDPRGRAYPAPPHLAFRSNGNIAIRQAGHPARSLRRSQTYNTPEQTILDLAHRPELGDSASDIPTAVAALYARCDQPRLKALATRQRRLASLRRAEDWVGALT
jgi:hypothetical protein